MYDATKVLRSLTCREVLEFFSEPGRDMLAPYTREFLKTGKGPLAPAGDNLLEIERFHPMLSKVHVVARYTRYVLAGYDFASSVNRVLQEIYFYNGLDTMNNRLYRALLKGRKQCS